MSEAGKLPATRFARLNAMFRKAEEAWGRGDDLRNEFGDIRAAGFWRWLNVHGVRDFEEYRELDYPVPDRELIGRVVGDRSTEADYRRTGVIDWTTTYRCLEESGFDFSGGGRLLDFGCGCARLLRLFAWHADTCELTGVDVDEFPIRWCRKNLDFASFERIPLSPPTALPADHFDGVYAWSVFSHLAETTHQAWLTELHRIARPGGAMVVTVQGRRVLDHLAVGSRPGDIPMTEAVRNRLESFESDGFAFVPYGMTRDDGGGHMEDWDLETYGSTFIDETYIRERWTDRFEILEVKLSPNEWQDYVLMRAR